MIMPGVQMPHCAPASFMKWCWSAWSVPSPSIVCTSETFDLREGNEARDDEHVVHEHGARAALAFAAPFLGAGEPQSSRSTSSRRFIGCASTSTGLPFSVKRMRSE